MNIYRLSLALCALLLAGCVQPAHSKIDTRGCSPGEAHDSYGCFPVCHHGYNGPTPCFVIEPYDRLPRSVFVKEHPPT